VRVALRRDGPFRICRNCRVQVREAPRHFRIAPFVALTKLASTDRSEPIAAATWALASSLHSIDKWTAQHWSMVQLQEVRATPALLPKLTFGFEQTQV
jgi:hypothetical protein